MAVLQPNFTRWILAAGVTLAAGIVLPALAEPPANQDGLMSFPNVRVVNAPAPTVAAPKVAEGLGMTAAVDSLGKLRPVTAEEAQRLAPAKPQNQLSAPSQQRAASAAQSDSAAPEMIYGPGNMVGARLTDESMVYQVAHKSDEGLELKEYTGKTAAEHAAAKPEPQPEVGHEHD